MMPRRARRRAQFLLEAVIQLSAEQQAALEVARDKVLGTAAELDTLPTGGNAGLPPAHVPALGRVRVQALAPRVEADSAPRARAPTSSAIENDALRPDGRQHAGGRHSGARAARVLWLDHPGRLAQSIVSRRGACRHRYTPDGRPISARHPGTSSTQCSASTLSRAARRASRCARGDAQRGAQVLRPADGERPARRSDRAVHRAAGAGGDYPAADVDEWQAAGVGKGDAHRLDAAQVGGVEGHAARQVGAPRQAAQGPYATDGKIGINGYKYYVCVEPAPNPNRGRYHTLVWILPEDAVDAGREDGRRALIGAAAAAARRPEQVGLPSRSAERGARLRHS